MTNDDDKFMGCIMALLAVLVSPLNWLLNGFVLSILWAWFMVPLGLPAIGKAHALGLACVIGLLSHQQPPDCASDKPAWARIGNSMIVSFVAPVLTLIIGWIAYRCMT
jgi:hypothetical protein